MVESENGGCAFYARVDFRFGAAAQLERKGDVLGDGHVRIERVVLKHHGNVALFRRQVVDTRSPMRMSPDVMFRARRSSAEGRFAAAGRPDQHDELAVAYRHVDAMDDRCRAEGFTYVANRDRSHPFLPAAAARILILTFLRFGASAQRRLAGGENNGSATM